MAGKANNRKFTRRPVQAKVELRLQTGILLEGQSRDISVRGVWFSTDRSLPIGNVTRVRMVFDTNVGELRIESLGRVVRDDEGGVAIEFVEIASDCENDLRRLVEDEYEEADPRVARTGT